jgi:hypothetical protein
MQYKKIYRQLRHLDGRHYHRIDDRVMPPHRMVSMEIVMGLLSYGFADDPCKRLSCQVPSVQAFTLDLPV